MIEYLTFQDARGQRYRQPVTVVEDESSGQPPLVIPQVSDSAVAALAVALTNVVLGAPYTTGLTAVTGDISLDRANGPFQEVTLTGNHSAADPATPRVLNAPANGSLGLRFFTRIRSTTGQARTLAMAGGIVKPSNDPITWPYNLTQGKVTYISLYHNGTAWELSEVRGDY